MRRLSMIFVGLLLVCAACGDDSNPIEVEVDPVMTIWFVPNGTDSIPHAQYYYDPMKFVAVEGHATVEPDADTYWCLDIGFIGNTGGITYDQGHYCGMNGPGEIAGQRLYLLRHGYPWQVRMRATSEGIDGQKLWAWDPTTQTGSVGGE